MGVFKWLRRERVTVTTRHMSPVATTPEETPTAQVGTIRTEEYKRDLAEFQARRSSNAKEESPKKRCGRHSLPISCTDCTDHDNTFNYEKKSALKYKKNHKRTKSEENDGVPNIQFLFQNQVFMPGNVFATASYSEPQKSKRHHRRHCRPEMDFLVQKHIDFKEDEQDSPPIFFKNNSLPFDVKNFLDRSRSDNEGVDGVDGSKTKAKVSSHSSLESPAKEDCCEDKLWEVMSELKNFDQWADEQLQAQSVNTSKTDDSKSDTSAYGLPIASSSNLDVTVEQSKAWNHGKWGVVPVHIKKLAGVTIGHVRKKRNTEINILRKCRHPNIILLMGLYPDVRNNVHIICERCVDSLFGVIHVQGRILSAQTSVQYALDIANALVFLRMQGYVHTGLTSAGIMVTARDTAKLADLSPCGKLPCRRPKLGYPYTPEPHYVNIEDAREATSDAEPLLTARSSEAYLAANAIAKDYNTYATSDQYHWQAPELFEPDENGMVHACSKSDVYSLCLILWECCNASLPWKSLSYDEVKERYTIWKTGLRPPQDGTYPGGLLALLQAGLGLARDARLDLHTAHRTLHAVKGDLDDMEYIIIPARLSKKHSNFTNQAWDSTESDCQSPKNMEHEAVIHNRDTSESDKDTNSSPLYETIRKTTSCATFGVAEKCYVSDEDGPTLKYDHLHEKDYSSACSTPIAKLRARIKDIATPGTLHRSDSTEYCSILSPDTRIAYLNDSKEQSIERPTTKLSRSFTPKSYKPLHIKVPEFNLDSIKSLLKDQNGSERSSYNFDIKNYSLPTTPIARSNKLRKNAWLSGDLNVNKERSDEKLKKASNSPTVEGIGQEYVESETPVVSINSSLEKNQEFEDYSSKKFSESEDPSPESVDAVRDSYTGLRRVEPPSDFSSLDLERRSSGSFKSIGRYREDVLMGVNVKPLVAIHEKWIYEANRKTGRSMSLPEDNRNQMQAVKPASHCVDTLQKSLPQLYIKRSSLTKPFRAPPCSPSGSRNGHQWEQYCQARDAVSKNINFAVRDPDRFSTWRKDDKGTTTEELASKDLKIDRSTDTKSIEEFIRELIRKEFQHLLHELSDDNTSGTVSTPRKNDDLVNKGVANILETLKNDEHEQTIKKEPVKSFSRVKINGNNKPLLQITFSRSGENSLQVLDNCVNVTICDSNSKLNQSLEDTLTDDVQVNSLKRCQAFNAIQEARSTEDLYIDDDLSAQMQENFGGKVKLIPLHGSLHEILCEKEDDCCLIKVKQENGCDTIYFRCDNSDTESRDAIDGTIENRPNDTVVFKRSISLIEERIQRVIPKDKRQTPVLKKRREPIERELRTRPKSEVMLQNINKESRTLSNSSPSLIMKDNDPVELNIENVMCYQDSSSEECLKCQVENDDFELLEREIEQDIANGTLSSLACGCLEKISEENLSVINEDVGEKI